MNNRLKICVVTGTRAEYGLLRWVMQGIQESELLELQLIVTGMHLSPEFGSTVQEIEADGFHIDHKVEKNYVQIIILLSFKNQIAYFCKQ